MAQMKNLTVNGQTYTVRDPDAARIDDTAVGGNAWSSKKQAATFANALTGTASGPVISLRDISPLSHDLTVTVDGDATAVTRLGKNWFDGSWESGFLNTTTGADSAHSRSIRTGYIPVVPNTTYYFTLPAGNIYPCTYDRDKAFCRYPGMKAKSFLFTTAENEYFIRISYYNSTAIPEAAQLELGSAATEYEPYVQPAAYPVSPDGTVSGIVPCWPNTVLYTDAGTLTAVYNRDVNKAIGALTQAIISLGGTV